MASPARATTTDLERVCNIESWLDDFSSTEKQAALDASSDLADGYLGVRYTLPLTVYGKDLVRCECWLAAKELLIGKGFSPESARDKQILDRAAEALQWLKDVAAKVISPAITDSSTSAVTFPRITSRTARGWATVDDE